MTLTERLCTLLAVCMYVTAGVVVTVRVCAGAATCCTPRARPCTTARCATGRSSASLLLRSGPITQTVPAVCQPRRLNKVAWRGRCGFALSERALCPAIRADHSVKTTKTIAPSSSSAAAAAALSRRGRSLPANAGGFDTHRDSISSRCDCRPPRALQAPAAAAHRPAPAGGGAPGAVSSQPAHIAHDTGAGEDHGIDSHQNWLIFPYDSTFLRSHDLHPHP